MDDRYGRDVLAQPRRQKPKAPEVAGEMGLVVEDAATGYCGAVVGWEKTYAADMVRLEDRRGATRVFHAYPAAFLIDGKPVTLVRPRGRGPNQPSRIQTASGSRALPKQRARTARASRIFVEGVHDATLLERVWGEDLRAEGVVVMSLDGLDNLDDALADFQPAPHRRAGVLVDHLVAGTKEAKLTAEVGPNVLVCGHPYIDVWEAVKPSAVKIAAWPTIPRGTDWKTGICEELGWGTPQDGWRRVLGAVSSFRDLEVPLIRSVEELIDFVTEPPE
ncbi:MULTISPECIES: DUF3097 domain-containing protein [unclassified Gordonia (in: high G+C Gram-positive bacteria)]|uniref:DUF3097 domain-containing protein n=1 Tax=unclassified Gordonia (in: high G+C Gram-positive bacteria) TaxID=2657482 RepID=UPI001FFF2095|nr:MULTISPECIES: DUF3097 domain-containing protein [unclassified Gordonia (in: high G+C Gram-positive bacteria)]UQE77028.1 DUF3097 domain-containing protein [Gordonia sp. PP30]